MSIEPVAALPAIEKLLPHAAPMILIDRVVAVGETWLEAEVAISEQTLFAEAGRGVPSWVGIEYVAQSIAAWAGYGAHVEGGLPQFGFLLGSRKYHASTPWFEFGSTLKVRVELQFRDQGLGVFSGRITAMDGTAMDGTATDGTATDGTATDCVLVEATVNVYQPDAAGGKK